MMATAVIDEGSTYDDKVNWLKGVLVMEITDEAIRPFVERENTNFQCDIKSNFGHISLCGKCRSTNASYCSSRICSGITSQIESVHRYRPPCYNNSDITKWLSDPWEIAKCYMSKSKDLEGKPGCDIDFSNVLTIVINNTRFERLIPAVDMTKTDNIFCKGRNARNKVMHLRSQQLPAHDLNHDCDIFIDIVKRIGTDKAEFVRKIEQVRDSPLSITSEDIVKLKEDAARDQGLTEVEIEHLKEEWREDAERIVKEEIKKVTGKSLIPSFIEGCEKSFCRLTIEHIKCLKPERTSKDDWTVEEFLKRLELQAETKDLSERHKKMLFPSSSSPLDIEQWDIFLYCFVLNIELHQTLDNRTLLFMKDAKLLRDNLLANPFGVDKSQLSNLCDYLDKPLKDDILMIFEREHTVADMMHANNVLQSWEKEEDKARYRRNQAEKDKLIFQAILGFNARLSQSEKNNGSASTESAAGRANESFDTKAELKPINASLAVIKKLQNSMTSPFQNDHVLHNTGANEHFGNSTKGCAITGIAEGSIILKVGCPSIESLFGFWEGCTDGTVVKAMSKIRDAYRKHLGCDTLEFDIVLKKKEVTRCTNLIVGDLNSRLERLETQPSDVPLSKPGLPMKYVGEEETSRLVKLLRQISESLGGGNISTVNTYIRDIVHHAKMDRKEEFDKSINNFTKMVMFKGGTSMNLIKQAIRGFDMIKEQPQFGDLVTSELDAIEKKTSEQIVKGTTKSQEKLRSVNLGTPIIKGVKHSFGSDLDNSSFKHMTKERTMLYEQPLGPTKLTKRPRHIFPSYKRMRETDSYMPTSPVSTHQSLAKGTEEQSMQGPSLRSEESQ